MKVPNINESKNEKTKKKKKKKKKKRESQACYKQTKEGVKKHTGSKGQCS